VNAEKTLGGKPSEVAARAGTAPAPKFNEAFWVWVTIGFLSFGGPAGQIALMHRKLVEERRWLSERQYLSALNFCMLLPGPEAMQLATYAGWRLHGVAGGLAAGLMFVLPGAVVMLALSMVYAAYGAVPLVEAVFIGIKAAVLAIVIDALIKVSRRALTGPVDYAIAMGAFVGIFIFDLPFPLIILAAGLIGYLRAGAVIQESASDADTLAQSGRSPPDVSIRDTCKTIAIWLTIWTAPLGLVALLLGPNDVLAQAGLFFSKLAVVSFGGAYAVLAYMAQEVVEGYGWLKPGEMLDGLGLAETTPGPLIMVTQFVGFLAAARAEGGVSLLTGALGAVVTLWATFAPCFLWIFAGAPYIERLQSAPRLRSALSAITAAVVGVIANLSAWFTMHVLFESFTAVGFGPMKGEVPVLASVDVVALALSCLAVVALFALRAGVLVTLLVCAAAGLAVHLIA